MNGTNLWGTKDGTVLNGINLWVTKDGTVLNGTNLWESKDGTVLNGTREEYAPGSMRRKTCKRVFIMYNCTAVQLYST